MTEVPEPGRRLQPGESGPVDVQASDIDGQARPVARTLLGVKEQRNASEWISTIPFWLGEMAI